MKRINPMHIPEVKEKYLKSMKIKVWNNKERNKKISKKLKGNSNAKGHKYICSEETKKKISETKKGTKSHRKGLKIEQEYGNKKANILKDKYRQNAINTLEKLKISKISKAEIKLKEYLESKHIKFIMQYRYPLGIADFYLPRYNLIIECYGKYWHSKPDYIKRDKKQQKWLKDNGYYFIIFNSEEIMKNKIKNVTLQIPDISKFQKDTGWKAEISFKKTMEDLLNWWRKNV